MKKQLTVSLAFGLVLLTGCNSVQDLGAYETGTQIEQSQLNSIKVGASQNDVIDVVGEPMRKQMLGKKELWYYDYTKIRHIGSNVSESTVFEFQNDKLLKHYKTGNSSNSNPLLDAANK